MGGGGGSDWYTRPSGGYEVSSDAQDREKVKAYEQDVNLYLLSLLSGYNDRDVDSINTHLNVIKNALDKDIDGVVDLVFGGSVSKHTYVNGLSDVDILVCVNDTSLADGSPESVKAYFADRLHTRLPESEITVGKLAVTVRFKSTGHEIQLLPALSTQKGVRIADPETGNWSDVIRPKEFATKLTEVNKQSSNRVVPVVKLVKALNATLSERKQLKGYHIESLAIEAFEGYKGPLTYKAMLEHFCRNAADRILTPIADTTGQSVHVDDYLGGANSHERAVCGGAWSRLAKRLDRADACIDVEEWKDMFGE